MFSTQMVIERLNALIDEFKNEKIVQGSVSDTVLMTLFWIKYGREQPDEAIQKRIDVMFANYKTSKRNRKNND